jgi:hypothetical protein
MPDATIQDTQGQDGAYNYAYLDEQTKRMIRRAILKAVAVPGYQVPFGGREMPLLLCRSRAHIRTQTQTHNVLAPAVAVAGAVAAIAIAGLRGEVQLRQSQSQL